MVNSKEGRASKLSQQPDEEAFSDTEQESVLEETKEWVGGIFANREAAERAYQTLLERGYESKDVNLLMTEETKQRYFQQESEETALHNKAHESGLDRAAAGAAKGAVLGTLLAVGSNMVLPGVGLFFGGPLFIGLGMLAGGLKSAFTESGIPEDQATRYETAIQEGQIVLGVMARNKEDAQYLRERWA